MLSVVHQGFSKSKVARRYYVSWQWVHKFVTRCEECDIEVVDARRSRPLSILMTTSLTSEIV